MAPRLSAVAATALVLAAPAAAQTPIVDRAAESARGRTVFVHPGTTGLTAAEARRIERQIESVANGPLYVAVLPAAARREVDGTVLGLALELSRRVVTTNPPAVHAVLVGDEFRAVNRDIDADRLATESSRVHRDNGVATMLLDFARRVGRARAEAGATSYAPLEQPATDAARADLWLAAITVGVLVGAALLFARRRHAR